MLAEQEMTKQEFREKLQIASGTMTKLNKGQEVSMSIILRMGCEHSFRVVERFIWHTNS